MRIQVSSAARVGTALCWILLGASGCQQPADSGSTWSDAVNDPNVEQVTIALTGLT